jgi:hypothetical protein
VALAAYLVRLGEATQQTSWTSPPVDRWRWSPTFFPVAALCAGLGLVLAVRGLRRHRGAARLLCFGCAAATAAMLLPTAAVVPGIELRMTGPPVLIAIAVLVLSSGVVLAAVTRGAGPVRTWLPAFLPGLLTVLLLAAWTVVSLLGRALSQGM